MGSHSSSSDSEHGYKHGKKEKKKDKHKKEKKAKHKKCKHEKGQHEKSDNTANGSHFVVSSPGFHSLHQSPQPSTSLGHYPSPHGHHPSVHGQPPSVHGHYPSSHDHHPSLHGQPTSLHGQPPFLHGQPPFLHGQSPSLQGQPPSLHGHHPSPHGHYPSLHDHRPSSYTATRDLGYHPSPTSLAHHRPESPPPAYSPYDHYRQPKELVASTDSNMSFQMPDFARHDAHEQAPQTAKPPQKTMPPPSGYRIPLTSKASFRYIEQTGAAPFRDLDGRSPVFVGSALLDNSVQPCKVCPMLVPACRLSYSGKEVEHDGRYDLLPITSDMEWVVAKEGVVPYGRRPVEGGYEADGEKLYHAVAFVQGIEVPGKAGHHLGGARIAFGGREHIFTGGYRILCWK